MAFVYESKRDFNFSTKENVTLGPGAYIGHTQLKVLKCEVPFHSTSLKDVSLKVSPLPGPGAYNSSNNLLKVDQFGRIRCSSSFAGNKSRFDKAKNELNPGPGSYNLKSNWENSKRSPPAKPQYKVLNTVTSVPSIPAQAQSFGYDETESGDLVCQKSPMPVHTGVGKDSIGPGHYNPKPVTEIYGTRGTVWHKSVLKSEALEKTSPNLGPGCYSDVIPSNWYKTKGSAAFLSSCKRDSYIPRNEDNYEYVDRDGNPGPGMYFLGNQANLKTGGEFQKFGTGEKRFKDPSNAVPGPGTYGQKTSKEKPQKKAPFATTELRFGLSKASPVPGPGAYKEVDFEDFLQKKCQNKKPGAFGVSETRFNAKNELNGPGPGEYEMKMQVGLHNTASQKPFSVFESRVERLKTKSPDFPAPGSYNLPSDFNKSRSKSPGGFCVWDHHRIEDQKLPLTDERRGKKAQKFESKFLEKFLEIPEKITKDDTGPGPCTYFKKPRKAGKEKPAVVSKVSRFKKSENINPGPGDYEGTGDLWNKKSFNPKF